jgi:hypothetical protein
VIAALGFSLLAARGLDAISRDPPRRLPAVARALAIASLVAGGATFFAGPLWQSWLRHAPDDPFFGPLDAAGSLTDLRMGLWQTAALAAALWMLLRLVGGRYAGWVVPLVLVLTAVDLSTAHSGLIPAAPLEYWQRPGYYARAIRGAAGGDEQQDATFRVYRGSRPRWLPAAWAHSASPDRQRQGLRWDIDTLAPKYHLQTGLSLVESYGTFASQDFSSTLRVARRWGLRRPDGLLEPHRGVLDALGARYLVLPPNVEYPHTQGIDAQAAPPDSSLWFNPGAFPRAWIVHDVLVLPPLRAHSPRGVERRTRDVWFPDGQLRDLRRQAVVEVQGAFAESQQLRPGGAALEAGDGESCRVIVDRPQQIQIAIRLQRPGLVVLSDLYYPGWVALRRGEHQDAAEAEPIPILRANRIMRGVWLPAGAHHLSFTYQPTLFRLGAALSALAWLAAAAALAALCFRRVRRHTSPRATRSVSEEQS